MAIIKKPSIVRMIGYVILCATFLGAIIGLIYLRTNWLQTTIDLVNASGAFGSEKLTVDAIKENVEMINEIAKLIGQPEGISYDALIEKGDNFFSALLVGGIMVYGGIIVIATLGLFNRLFKILAGLLSIITGIGIIGAIIYLAGKNK